METSMSTQSTIQHGGDLAGQRRARRRGLVVLAAAAVVGLLAAIGDAQPPREGATLAAPAPIQDNQDWHGNSALFQPFRPAR
jgi:hypothetical protein